MSLLSRLFKKKEPVPSWSEVQLFRERSMDKLQQEIEDSRIEREIESCARQYLMNEKTYTRWEDMGKLMMANVRVEERIKCYNIHDYKTARFHNKDIRLLISNRYEELKAQDEMTVTSKPVKL